jgi:hypothetical protein
MDDAVQQYVVPDDGNRETPFSRKQGVRCNWCLNPFERTRRPFAEVEALRHVLRVDMTTPFDPPICDGCYNGVMACAVPGERVDGVKAPVAHGTPNLVLTGLPE